MIDSKTALAKSFDKLDESMEYGLDMFRLYLSNFTWSHQQVERMLQLYMDRSRESIGEGTRFAEQIFQRVQNSQANMVNMVRETFNCTLENIDNVDRPVGSYWAEIGKKYQNYFQKDVDVA